MLVATHQRRCRRIKYLQNGALGFVCISTFKVQLTLIYNVSSEYFDDTDLDDDDVEFESFTPEDIRGRPVDLPPNRSSGCTNHWYCYFSFDIGNNEGANLRHDMAE